MPSLPKSSSPGNRATCRPPPSKETPFSSNGRFSDRALLLATKELVTSSSPKTAPRLSNANLENVLPARPFLRNARHFSWPQNRETSLSARSPQSAPQLPTTERKRHSKRVARNRVTLLDQTENIFAFNRFPANRAVPLDRRTKGRRRQRWFPASTPLILTAEQKRRRQRRFQKAPRSCRPKWKTSV